MKGTRKLGQLEVSLDELAEFLVLAKKECYAGERKPEVLADGSKQMTFQQGNFHYTDNWAGSIQAPGTEIVRWEKPEGQRIWQMSYCGGMLNSNQGLAEQTFRFLRRALSSVPVDAPFRGPRSFVDKDFEQFHYQFMFEGDLERFFGKETIYRYLKSMQNPSVTEFGGYLFSQEVMGGLVIPK